MGNFLTSEENIEIETRDRSATVKMTDQEVVDYCLKHNYDKAVQLIDQIPQSQIQQIQEILNVDNITNKEDVGSQLGLVDDETKLRELADLLKQIESDLYAKKKAAV